MGLIIRAEPPGAESAEDVWIGGENQEVSANEWFVVLSALGS